MSFSVPREVTTFQGVCGKETVFPFLLLIQTHQYIFHNFLLTKLYTKVLIICR